MSESDSLRDSFASRASRLKLNSIVDTYQLTGVRGNQQVSINLSSTQFDTKLKLLDAATRTPIAESDDIAENNTNSALTFTVQSGVQYLIQATSEGLQTGDYTLIASTSSAIVGDLALGQTLTSNLTITDLENPARPGSFSDDYRLTGILPDRQVDYRIRVTSALPNAIGSYTLTTTPVVAPTPTPTPEPTPTPTPVPVDFFSEKIKDAQLQTLGRNSAADGDLNRNDMLALLRDVQDGGVVEAAEIIDLRQLIDNSTRFKMPDYVQYLSRKMVEAASANINAAAFENELIGKWFLGKVAPPADFTFKTIDEFGSVRNDFYQFQYAELKGSLFGSAGEARIGHIDQGGLGDCAFLAALGATFGRQNNDAGNQASSIIQSAIVDNGDNTYSIRFYNEETLKAEYVTVDRRVAIKDGKIFGASADGETDPNNPSNKAIWVPLFERAYAQFMQEKDGIPKDGSIPNGYNRIGNGDNVTDPLTRITGQKSNSFPTELGTFGIIQNAPNQFVESGTGGKGNVQQLSEYLIVNNHAYSVTNVYVNAAGEQRIVVRNPHGGDSQHPLGGTFAKDGVNDGFIELAYKDFMRFYSDVGITE